MNNLEKTLSSLATQSEFDMAGSPEDLLQHIQQKVKSEKYMRRMMDHLYLVVTSNVESPVDVSSGETFVGQTRNVGESKRRRLPLECKCRGCEEKFPNRSMLMKHNWQCRSRSKRNSDVIKGKEVASVSPGILPLPKVPRASTSLVENSAEQHGVDDGMDDDIVDVVALPASASSMSSVWRESSQNGA